jgi:hypothetical protein
MRDMESSEDIIKDLQDHWKWAVNLDSPEEEIGYKKSHPYRDRLLDLANALNKEKYELDQRAKRIKRWEWLTDNILPYGILIIDIVFRIFGK